MPTALILENDPQHMLDLSKLAGDCGFAVESADDVNNARKQLRRIMPDVALVNVQTDGDGEGTKLLDLFAQSNVADIVEVYLIDGNPDLDTARRGMQVGASDYFIWPDETGRLKKTLASLQGIIRKREEEAEDIGRDSHWLLHGKSPAMKRVYRLIRKVAPTQATVLLIGESGTGKELVARTLHDLSPRHSEPFIAVNCGAVASDLIESELFGHIKGAFTGADSSHKGFFERASGGTLLLDEVTEMSAGLQVKLLRVLETRQIRRVGGEQELEVDVRIIGSTNRDPEEALNEGILREDLYYRLAEFPLRVPPLRDRGEDIVLLAKQFLREANERDGQDKSISEEALDLLRLHSWPGNVRELKNAVFRACILANNKVRPDDLPGNIPSGAALHGDSLRFPVGYSLKEVERRVILATLDHYDDDKARAAEVLGISLKTLYNRLKSYRGG